MKKELWQFLEENNLSPFSRTKTATKPNPSIYKTKDAKSIHTKFLNTISKNFIFAETSNLLNCFSFTLDPQEINYRQNFSREIQNQPVSKLPEIEKPRPTWKAPYNTTIVTEDDRVFSELQKKGAPVKFIISETDVKSLEDYDTVQIIECEQFGRVLEQLPQGIFLSSTDEAYLEQYVEQLSGWQNNFDLLESTLDPEIKQLIEEIKPLFSLLDKNNTEKISEESVEHSLIQINEEISERVKALTLSGDSLMEILAKGTLTPELKEIVKEAINKTDLPRNFLIPRIPVSIDKEELQNTIRAQEMKGFTFVSEKIRDQANALITLPGKLKRLEKLLILADFKSGLAHWMKNKTALPKISETFSLRESPNIFLNNPQPITFHLNSEHRCSILTGANSGGKTTLLEHIIQAISTAQLGLPINGQTQVPLFSEIYYFAKSKGSNDKGAFEMLLTQMSQIKTGAKTLILADEIEAVTEPGVAGKMITATADFFIKRGCFLVIATHLGQEIIKSLPRGARIDGIEAQGLDANNELIINHNPVLGKLANSTPELIVEKMARASDSEYFQHINSFLKSGRHLENPQSLNQARF